MPKRSSKRPEREDENEAAFRVVQEATCDEDEDQPDEPAKPAPTPKKKRKDPAAVALGRKGGKKGGKARAAKLTPERRVEIAKKAAAARWRDKNEG